MQVDENVAGLLRHKTSAVSSPTDKGTGYMVSKKMDERRDGSRLRPSGEGVVLLQRRNSKVKVRKYDKVRNEGGSSSSSDKRIRERKGGNMATFNIERLTAGETLLLARRRSGESQEKCADRYGLTRNAYGKFERDDETYTNIKIPELNELTDAEKCLILRRRSGLTQDECAEEIGITRFWFNRMEVGKVDASSLVAYWGERA